MKTKRKKKLSEAELDAVSKDVLNEAIRLGYLVDNGDGTVSDQMTIKIGKHRQRTIERTPTNFALLKAVHHFSSIGRMSAEDVAAKASEILGETITTATAQGFFDLMFEPQSDEERVQMIADLKDFRDEGIATGKLKERAH
jgi:hypothetical protein